MERVVVERVFDDPVEFEAVQQCENKAAWCFEMHRVRHLLSYFSRDQRRMICIYEAPDADAVREACLKSGAPFERVWTATFFGPGGQPDEDE
jgi:hypothetical protein